jgi:hypothetical protein
MTLSGSKTSTRSSSTVAIESGDFALVWYIGHGS